MGRFGRIVKLATVAAVFAGAVMFANAQTEDAQAPVEWLNENWRTANYPLDVWYTGFAQDRAAQGTRTAEALRSVERQAQNRLVERIAVRVSAESRQHTVSARRETGGAARESVDRTYGQLIEASATAEVVNAQVFSHFDPETRTVSAFAAVRREDLANYYESQIEMGLSEAQRLLEHGDQLIEMGRRIEALERITESRARVDALNFYRDLLVTVDQQNGLARSQGDRMNELLTRIAATLNAHERPQIVVVIQNLSNAGVELSAAQKRVLKSRFVTPFTASNLYGVVDRNDVFLTDDVVSRVRLEDGALNLTEAYAVAIEAGAQYLCVVDIVANESGGAVVGFHVSARLIDAASGTVFGSPGQSDINDLDNIDQAANMIFRQIHVNTGSLGDGALMTDARDGKIYRTVTIGNQVWMAENLNFASPNSWCYNNDENLCRTHGRIYTFDAAMGACPGGWRLPRRRDWDELIQHAGGWRVAGGRLKSRHDWNGTDDFGFCALPSGGRTCGGDGFALMGENAYWWSSTEVDRERAYGRGVESGETFIGEGRNRKSCGFSVRCIRN